MWLAELVSMRAKRSCGDEASRIRFPSHSWPLFRDSPSALRSCSEFTIPGANYQLRPSCFRPLPGKAGRHHERCSVFSSRSVLAPSVRDRHIAEIQTKGRMAWQKSSGYNQRSRVETQMGRWKAVIAPKFKVRHFDNQTTEAKIGVHVLNRMTELVRPECKRVA